MIEAAHNRNKAIKDALSGHCYQQTLRALELCAEEGEKLPALFKSPLYEQTVEPDQMFSNESACAVIRTAGFGMRGLMAREGHRFDG